MMPVSRPFGKQDSRQPTKNLFIPDRASILSAMQRGTLRRTKIVSTLGPATDSAEMIGKLMDAGVNIFRLNMSHAPHDWVRRVFDSMLSLIHICRCRRIER